ncbi:MAG: GtrA family protein [Synechococcaceae cyanobacterium]|nr:GtrA family protein [Synechococcaceae cyanobacterium]
MRDSASSPGSIASHRGIQRQFLKYLVVGGLSNGCAYGLYVALSAFGLSPITSMTLVYLAACGIGFSANRSWTFASRSSVPTTLIKYLLIQVIGYLTNLAILLTLHYGLGFPHLLSQLVGVAIVAVELFILSRWFVFA